MVSLLKNAVAGLIITHNFTNVVPALTQIASRLSDEGKENIKKSIALHEFGHAIGLRHEDSHPDSTCESFDENLGTGIPIGSYDERSAMNRCFYRSVDYNVDVVPFSQGDQETFHVFTVTKTSLRALIRPAIKTTRHRNGSCGFILSPDPLTKS